MIGAILGAGNRAISKEGMAAIGFGLTVLMMAVSGGLLMQTGDDLSEGGPIATASAEPIDASNSPDGQWVRITHESGQTLDVSNLTLNVSVPDHRKRATLTGLPTDGIEQSDYEGNHVFTLGPAGVDGVARADSDATWAAGETIAVRIEDKRVDLVPGETVRVTIRHTGEQQRVFRERVDVVDS